MVKHRDPAVCELNLSSTTSVILGQVFSLSMSQIPDL